MDNGCTLLRHRAAILRARTPGRAEGEQEIEIGDSRSQFIPATIRECVNPRRDKRCTRGNLARRKTQRNNDRGANPVLKIRPRDTRSERRNQSD